MKIPQEGQYLVSTDGIVGRVDRVDSNQYGAYETCIYYTWMYPGGGHSVSVTLVEFQKYIHENKFYYIDSEKARMLLKVRGLQHDPQRF